MDDVIFAHNVPAYIATRNEHALEVTPRVAARWGAESAVTTALFAVANLNIANATRITNNVDSAAAVM